MKMKSMTGFTLIELVIAIAVLGIITTVAVGNYSGYVRKGRRVDAINMLLSISLAQEKYRSANTTYGTLGQVWSGVSTSPEGFYTVAISNVSATSYTLTATAQGNQASDTAGGTSCAALVLAMTNGTITKSPSACWPV